jgi:cytochrome c
MSRIIAATFTVAAVLLSHNAFAQEGDVAAGETVFKKCSACHNVADTKHKVGPSLQGVVGRQPGVVEGFKFSKAMVDYGAGKVWDDATLAAYLENPRGVVKGTRMAFAGLKDPKEIADVIAYLKAHPTP